MHRYIDIVCDGPPGPEAGRFVEVEDADGKSINAGDWLEREGGKFWSLRISRELFVGQHAEPDGAEYAIVEIYGHRKHAGRVIEVERFGAKQLRIDIPKDGDFEEGFTTVFYGGSSIFSFTPCDLESVQRANKPYAPASRLSYRAPEADDHFEEEPF